MEVMHFPTYQIEPIDTLEIKEQCTGTDGLALRQLANIVAKKDALFVEIGSWMGYSSSFLGQVAKECGGHVYCVDHWKGSPGVPHHNIDNCFEIFTHNMEVLGLSDYVHPLVMDSLTASRIFTDGIADLVFIDADHRYKQIKQDIEAWYPKVRNGGIICGHDCDAYYSTYDQHFVDCFPEEDYIVGKTRGVHPGIMKALYEYFDDKHFVMGDTTVWFVRKEIKLLKENND